MSTSNHHLVSPTAKLVAYMRAKSDIPYSAQIARLTNSEEVAKEIVGLNDIDWWMSASLVLRYKSLSVLVQREALDKGITNILELAAGILPRGLVLSQNKNVHYIETDLPEMIEEKKKLIAELGVTFPADRLSFHPLNALDKTALVEIVKLFPPGPVCIINEGLLQYLSSAEKQVVAENIASVLRERGGLWITPDVSNSQRMKEILGKYPQMEAVLQRLNTLTQRDLKANSLGTPAEAVAFYAKCGLEAIEYKQPDLVPTTEFLTGFSLLDSQKQSLLNTILKNSTVWVLGVKLAPAP